LITGMVFSSFDTMIEDDDASIVNLVPTTGA
jgi:hypothetical protein